MSALQPLKDYLDLHKRERRGLLVLAFLLVSIFFLMACVPYFIQPDIPNKELLEQSMNDAITHRDSVFLANQNKPKQALGSWKKNRTISHSSTKGKKKKSEIKLFKFDPNTASDVDFENLGLNSGQIRTIRKYKSKGGKYVNSNDFSKMYCISEEQFLKLSPYIQIEKELLREDKVTEVLPPWEEKINELNINTADTTSLKKLKGIGSYYAKKIVEYREELGGYVHSNQLMEIWNFNQETCDEVSSILKIENSDVLKININTSEPKVLAKHPYISWQVAKAIVSYREQHGAYSAIDQITKSHLISEELCQKLKPYLRIE